jgi:hypothetical protein
MSVPVRPEPKNTKSLSDVFNQFAQDSIDRFPALKGKLLIYDKNEKKTYGRESLSQVKGTAAELDAFINKRKDDDGSYSEKSPSLNLDFVIYTEPVKAAERKNVSAATEKDFYFIMDHELAHLAIKDPALEGENAQYHDNIMEALADAYALIRHYQRFGINDTHKNSIIDSWARASALMLNDDTIHFSSFMIDEIIKRKDTIDYAHLTPHQTAELAVRFATEFTPPASSLNRVLKKLRPVRQMFDLNPKSDQWLKTLAEVTLNPKNDAATFKLCAKILGGYLDGRTDMDGLSVKAIGAEWDAIRQKLAAAQQRYAKEDILFNIPEMKFKTQPVVQKFAA